VGNGIAPQCARAAEDVDMKNSRGKSIKDREGNKQLNEIEDKQRVYNEK
jgi:hypothetical protein